MRYIEPILIRSKDLCSLYSGIRFMDVANISIVYALVRQQADRIRYILKDRWFNTIYTNGNNKLPDDVHTCLNTTIPDLRLLVMIPEVHMSQKIAQLVY